MPPKKANGEDGEGMAKKKSKKRANEENGSGDAASDSSGESDEEEAMTEYKSGGASSAKKAKIATPANGTDDDDEGGEMKLEGSMINGQLLLCGGTNWDMVGRSKLPAGAKNLGGPNLWSPHRVKSMSDLRVRTVVSSSTACHSIVITTEGKAYTFGRNEKGQLGHGDMLRRDTPTFVEALEGLNIIDAACGKNHTLFITEKGHVYACGDNKMAQLGFGNQSDPVTSPARISHKGPPVRRAACGAEFSIIADVSGNIFTFGCPEYGQLGHNSDGKYFVTSTKMGYRCETRPRRVQVFFEKQKDGQIQQVTDVEVDDVACGTNHCIIMDRKKRIFTWGFGGYGRLGHSEQKDELVPRLLKVFDGPNRGAVMIAAGSSYSMAVNECKMLYLWGQQKPTGEAAMYPKPIQDLCGWKIRSIGCCNRSVVIAADDSLISWGPSPTYGELGYGDGKSKSSSYPQEVKPMDGIYVHKVACGYAHALIIARSDSDEDKEKLGKLPEFEPDIKAA